MQDDARRRGRRDDRPRRAGGALEPRRGRRRHRLSGTYRNEDLHYSFTLPDGWVAMPAEVLAGRGYDEPPAGAPAPVAAFQAPADHWFHPPALVVSHLPGKGLRPERLRRDLDRELQLGGPEARSIVYDDRRGAVAVAEHDTTSDGSRIERVAVFKPTTGGTLHLDFYLLPDEFPAWGDADLRRVLAQHTPRPSSSST